MPIQILWGNDLNAQNTFIQKLIDKEVSKEWKEINITSLNGDDDEQVNKAFDEVLTPPFGDGYRIVTLKNNHTKLTKTAYGLSEGWKELSSLNSGSKSPIVVIGSSPTALTYLIDILENAKDLPSLIIGMPVGFIGVEKSKNKLISTDLPRIVMNSTRGGAAMAAAAVNALLRETM